jgi:hypothetical protein
MKLVTRLLTRYWGYLAVVIAVAGFFLHSVGLAAVISLALAALGYFLFQAPMWCGAETRKNEWCRNNSHGLLLGVPHSGAQVAAGQADLHPGRRASASQDE